MPLTKSEIALLSDWESSTNTIVADLCMNMHSGEGREFGLRKVGVWAKESPSLQ